MGVLSANPELKHLYTKHLKGYQPGSGVGPGVYVTGAIDSACDGWYPRSDRSEGPPYADWVPGKSFWRNHTGPYWYKHESRRSPYYIYQHTSSPKSSWYFGTRDTSCLMWSPHDYVGMDQPLVNGWRHRDSSGLPIDTDLT